MARSTVGLALLALGLSLVAAPGTRAAFPGDNGRIVFRAAPNYSVFMFASPLPYGLYVVEPDGNYGRPLRLGAYGTGFSPDFGSPAWSPDGSEIAYGHFDPHKGAGIRVMDADGSGGRVVVPDSGEGPGYPAWSPDGSLIAFTQAASPGYSGIWIVGAEGGEPRLVVDRAGQPAWSPDCSRIAFLPGPSGDPGDIRTLDAQGRERPLTAGLEPNWSPDGRRIAFWRYGDNGDPEIRIIEADGSSERRLTGGTHPAWSPDGREIVYTTRRGLQATPVQDGATRTVTRRVDEYHTDPDWQPLGGTPLDPDLCAAWRDPVLPSLHLSVRPRRVLVGRATRFRLRATALDEEGSEGVPGALVRFAGRRRSTDARGRTDVLHTFRRPGRRRFTADKPGFSPTRSTVRIVEPRRFRGRRQNGP